MTTIDPQEIKLFRYAEDLPAELWRELAKRQPAEAAQAAGAELVDGVFRLRLMEREYLIDPASHTVRESARPEHRVGFQAGLVVVTSLAHAQPIPPSGRMVTPHELPGGRMFFAGPHAIANEPMAQRYGNNPRGLVERALALGGEECEGADAAVKFMALPFLPMWVLLWAGDDEFEARAVMGIDQRAHLHLALDVIWALTNIVSHRLCR